MTERIANDSSDGTGDRAHRNRNQCGRPDIQRLDRPGDGDQRQPEGIEPQECPVA